MREISEMRKRYLDKTRPVRVLALDVIVPPIYNRDRDDFLDGRCSARMIVDPAQPTFRITVLDYTKPWGTVDNHG